MELTGEMERRRQGFMTSASDRRRAQAVTRREEELADGFAEMRFAGLRTVSARDGEELERASGASSSGCTGSRRRPRRTRCPSAENYASQYLHRLVQGDERPPDNQSRPTCDPKRKTLPFRT
jgi:hypothetical protein